MVKASRAVAILSLAAVVAALGACEPCAGMGNCYGEPHLTLNGSVRDDSTGARVAGARIDFIRTGGVALASDSIRALTDEHGNFVLKVMASVSGDVTGEIVVRPPVAIVPPPLDYRIVDLEFTTSLLRGDAHVFPPWSTRPSLPDLAQLRRAGVPIANVLVEFRRTRGVPLAGSDTFRVLTDDGGVFPLFQNYVRPGAAGNLFGDVYVDGVLSYRNVRLIATPAFRPNTVMRFIDLADSAALGARR